MEPSLVYPRQSDLQSMLLRGYVPGDTAVLVPVTGKKAIVLSARWGVVATDAGTVDWQRSHASALGSVLQLRAMGFREGGFVEPLPPWPVLKGLGPTDRKEAQRLWQVLAPAREDRALLPLLMRISRSDN